jgi:hypothetical protein
VTETLGARSLRLLGGAAALAWVALALNTAGAWPLAGFAVAAVVLAGALALAPASRGLVRVLMAPPRVVFVAACAAAAAWLSWWTVGRAMLGQPLSIDAGAYVLQARALAHGHFGVAPPHPAQAFGDHFLLEGPDGRLYGIFPPGWPLALAPFAAFGRLMLAGPAVAVLLVLAQASLGRAMGQAAGDEEAGELATRASLLLSLTSVGRALETADLLSHAFVGALAAFAMAGALRWGREKGEIVSKAMIWRTVLTGACVGWVLASRYLDGVVLAFVVAGVLTWRRATWHTLLWGAVGAAPFLVLALLEQHAATGTWLLPTQTAYFARSDWPPTCHRLGFGADIGCTVEHPGPTSRLGGDGYDLRDALAVTRERAGALGGDLLGWPPLVLVAFVPVVLGASTAVDAAALAFVLALTLAYALFYYGNAMFFGARHLFPLGPFVWLLVARAATVSRAPRARGAAVAAILATAVWCVRAPWSERTKAAASFQSLRSDLRASMAAAHVDQGIVRTGDLCAFLTAFDPVVDGDARLPALDDGSGLLELRRAHPALPLWISFAHDQLGKTYGGPPGPGALVELERSWPTFVRPAGLATRQEAQSGASGGAVLLLSHATPGAGVAIPFETAVAGTYALRVDGFRGPDEGDYALALDGEPLPAWTGYAPAVEAAPGPKVTRDLPAGRHVLVARCTGRDAASTGYDARLDALVGEGVAPQEPLP